MSDDLNPADRAQWKALDAAASFAATCAELRDAPPEARVALDDVMNTLMTELWDRYFGQAEIRAAFNAALADMNRYAAGHEQRR